MRIEPLSFYVDKLKNKDYFSLIRFGDGELYCLWGAKGANSNGCNYTPELRMGLEDSLKHTESNFLYGMQHVLPQDKKRAEELYKVDWLDSEIFGEALAEGKLFPLIEQLRKMNTVVMGNASIKEAVKVIDCKHFIEVPPANALLEWDRVRDECVALAPACFLFSCGMAANVFISELHGLKDSFLLDLGHIWDAFAGNMSRCDLQGKTLEEINKNLCI
jgi:hypothetical protein